MPCVEPHAGGRPHGEVKEVPEFANDARKQPAALAPQEPRSDFRNSSRSLCAFVAQAASSRLIAPGMDRALARVGLWSLMSNGD